MKPLSYQLYSSRNFGPLAETLKMVAGVGYTQVEGYGGLYSTNDAAKQMRADMDAANVSMPSGHFGLDMVEDTPSEVAAIAETLGIQHVFVPFLAPDQRPFDMNGWRAFGARLAEAGKPLQAAGLSFGWHNHDFEFAALDGAYPIEGILEGGPNLSFEYDVAWAERAGADAAAFIDKYADRITAAHVKDIAPNGEATDQDGWADVGDGVMNWASCLQKLQAAGCSLLVAEHDNPSDDQRFATRSFNNIQAM